MIALQITAMVLCCMLVLAACIALETHHPRIASALLWSALALVVLSVATLF